MIKVIALDLEGTLISNAMSQISRPYLYEFLQGCKSITDRVVIFTTVKEDKFREIAQLLVSENKAPQWFAEVEYINWDGKTKDLNFIPGAEIEEIILIDDYKDYVKADQIKQWIEIKQFEHPYSDDDKELLAILDKVERLDPMRYIAKHSTVTFPDNPFFDLVYIFLDIDGVLHPFDADYDFDKNCINALAAVLKELDDPYIVISSSWREMYSLEEMEDRIGPLAQYVIGVTPMAEHRADDILKWLDENADNNDTWIAIDDESRPFIERDVHHHLLEIDAETGFTENDTERLLEQVKAMREIKK